MRKGVFRLTDSFTPAMDAIRQMGFPPKNEVKTLRDSFDEKGLSVHLFLDVDGTMAVYHRFTDNLNGKKLVMQEWTQGEVPLPKSGVCMEMGRFVIALGFRKTDSLFDCFVLMGLMYAQRAGYDFVVTGIRDERNLINRCQELGFDVEEKRTDVTIPKGGSFKARTLIFDLRRNGHKLEPLFKAHSAVLAAKGMTLDYEFLNSVSRVVPISSEATPVSRISQGLFHPSAKAGEHFMPRSRL